MVPCQALPNLGRAAPCCLLNHFSWPWRIVMLSWAYAYYLMVSPSSSGHRPRQSSVWFHCTMVNGLLVTDFFFFSVLSNSYGTTLKFIFFLINYFSLSPLGILRAGFCLFLFSPGLVKVRVSELSSFYTDTNRYWGAIEASAAVSFASWFSQQEYCCNYSFSSTLVLLTPCLCLLHWNPIQGKRLES